MPVASSLPRRSPRRVPSPQRRRDRRERREWLLRALSGVQSLERLRESMAWWPEWGTDPQPVGEPPLRAVVPGVVHAHTRFSDGAGTVPDVIAAAKAVGARFLVLSDHDTLAAAQYGWEGYHQGVLVLVGAEIKTDAGYLLGLDLPPDFRPSSQRAHTVLDEILESGGMAFAALPAHPGIGWREWDHPALVGLEVLNIHSLARHAACPWALLEVALGAALGSGVKALRSLARHPRRELALWDRMLARGRAVGLGSADAHGSLKLGKRHVAFPGYEESFQLVQTHLVLPGTLTGDARIDRDRVLAALRAGNCRSVYALHGDAAPFAFWREGVLGFTEGQTASSGSGRPVVGDRLCVRSPYEDTLYRLVRDGCEVGRAAGAAAAFPCEVPGAYRLEAFRTATHAGTLQVGVRPWLFTNPIYVEERSAVHNTESALPRTSPTVGMQRSH